MPEDCRTSPKTIYRIVAEGPAVQRASVLAVALLLFASSVTTAQTQPTNEGREAWATDPKSWILEGSPCGDYRDDLQRPAPQMDLRQQGVADSSLSSM